MVFLCAPPLLAQPTAAPAVPDAVLGGEPPLGDGCDEGVVKDDGIPERGYSWVPSAIYGIYVQVFERSDIARPGIDEVCVCWRRSREDESIDFEVVFYRDVDGNPEEEPFAAVPGFVDGVPDPADGGPPGKFVRVPTPGVRLPAAGRFYVGVRWNPSVDQFLFVCDDQSETTERVNIWFRDDRAEGWDNAFETNDSIFDAHRALLVRPVGTQIGVTDVPLMDRRGLALLAAILLGGGVLALRRKS